MKLWHILLVFGICLAICAIVKYAFILLAICFIVLVFKLITQWNKMMNWLRGRK